MRTYFLGDFDAEWGRILIYSTEWQVKIGKKEAAVSIKGNSNILYRLILNTYLFNLSNIRILKRFIPNLNTSFIKSKFHGDNTKANIIISCNKFQTAVTCNGF